MVTLRVNVVALIVAAVLAFMFFVVLKGRFQNADMAIIAVPVFLVIRVYDFIAGMPAFKGKGGKDGKK